MCIAFATYDQLPELTEDDKVLASYLSQQNHKVVPVQWDDATVNWKDFDVIVLRSTWDYFTRPEAFNEWIGQLENEQARVLNPLSIVKWNQDKNYFDKFSGKGIQLPPYVICHKNETHSLQKIMEDKGWAKAVVKPAISGGSYHTWIVNSEDTTEHQEKFTTLLKTGDVIVQQFVEEIMTTGEFSLVYFDKQFSHAFCKKAKPGEFRVQPQYGGTEIPIQPAKEILELASTILNNIPEPLLYARVDGVLKDDGIFLLMELELIEPRLSVAGHPNACENFHSALLKIMQELGWDIPANN